MTLRYYAGTTSNGNIDINNPLPVIDVSDSISCDINGVQKAVIKIARDKLPTRGYWRTELKRLDTMIVLIDDDQPWNSPTAVLFAGYLATVPAVIGESLTLSVNGLREYWALRIINRTYNATITDPTTQYDYTASTWQGVLNALITECHSSVGIPNNAAKPPFILGNVSGSVSGTGYSYPVKPTNSKKYVDVIDDIRDGASLAGNEYRLVPRLSSPSRNNIVIDVVIAPDNNPHINEDQTLNVQLSNDVTANSDYKILGFELSQDGTNYFNRIISQSIAGNSTTDADLTTKTVIGGPSILVDSFFNPNVQGGLTAAQMAAQSDARLTLGIQQELTGTFTISGNQGQWLNRLGTMLNFQTQAGVSDGFDGQMRFTDIKFSASDNKITIGCMTKKARYPRLPNTAPSSFNSNQGNVVPPNKGGTPPDPIGGTPAGDGKKKDDGFGTGKPKQNQTPIEFDHGIFSEVTGVPNDMMMTQFGVWGDNTNNQIGNYWQGPEGITVIPNPVDKRFFGLSWIACLTKKYDDGPRLAPKNLDIFASLQFTGMPTFSAPDPNTGYVHVNNVGSGIGRTIGTIDSGIIQEQMLSDVHPDDNTRHFIMERLANGILVLGPAGAQTIIVYFHQLQLFIGADGFGTWIQSKSFAFQADILRDPDGDAVILGANPWTAVSSPWETNGDTTYYTTPLQVETYGADRKFVAMCTPNEYPKNQYFDENLAESVFQNIFSMLDYWDKIYQGRFSVSPNLLIYNLKNNSLKTVQSPVYDVTLFQTAYPSYNNYWATPYQLKVYKNEFYAVSLTSETYSAARTMPGQDIGNAFLRFFMKSKINLDGTPVKWETLAYQYDTIDNFKFATWGDISGSQHKAIDIYRMPGYKGIVQIGGFSTVGAVDDAITPPSDWDGQPTVLANQSGTNACRVLYNTKNANETGVFDGNSVTSLHKQWRPYGYPVFYYNFLDFAGYSVTTKDSLMTESTLYLWKDCGDVVLPIWNIGQYDYQPNGGSHNGKFLEFDDYIVSQAPTMSYLFKGDVSQDRENYNYTWSWRK